MRMRTSIGTCFYLTSIPVRIIEISDSRGSDNRGSTVLVLSGFVKNFHDVRQVFLNNPRILKISPPT